VSDLEAGVVDVVELDAILNGAPLVRELFTKARRAKP